MKATLMCGHEAVEDGRYLVLLTKFVSAQEKSPRSALFALKATVAKLLPENRVAICYHHRLPNIETVNLWFSPEAKRAYYRGLMKCGQGWICPVCAQRLAIIRRNALRLAIDNTRSQFVPLMVTYTSAHHNGQPLREVLSRMGEAYRRMRRLRLWRTYKEEYMIAGETRATEITYGSNGWHPHFHVIVWLDIAILEVIRDELDRMDLRSLGAALGRHLTPLWIDCLQAVGAVGAEGIALNVKTTTDSLTDYVTKAGTVLPADGRKWGLAEETALGQLKHGRQDGKTPWELLIEAFTEYKISGDLFIEYAKATKGKSALQWTPGMKKLCGIDLDETAAIMAEPQEYDEILLAEFTVEQWREIVEAGAVGEVLDIASRGDPSRLALAMDTLHRRAAASRITIPD